VLAWGLLVPALACQDTVEREATQSVSQAASVPSGLTDLSVATGITSPTSLTLLPDGRVFVTEQLGKVRVIENDVLLSTNFLDITGETLGDQERGLLGITIDPNFATNRYVYLYHTANSPTAHNRIIRVTASATNPNVADVSTKKTIVDLEDIETPEDTEVVATWHHGGQLHFGADGNLYVSVGDHRHGAYAQDDNTTKGKILRMTINSDGTWTVPSDNPFCTTQGLIKCLNYRKGVRNPFTFDIRPGTNDLYIGDVGNNSWEEVNVALASDPSNRRNFGWPVTEGDFSNDTYPDFKRPAHTYPHGTNPGQGCAVVGAGFYPSSGPWPSQFHGKFFFMDFCGTGSNNNAIAGGVMRTLDPATNVVSEFATGLVFPIALAIKPDGSELYYLERGQRTGTPTVGMGGVRKINHFTAQAVITDNPRDVTVHAEAGDPLENATFTCAASGSPMPTIFWQRSNNGGTNFSDVGVTGGTYTLVGAALTDNGAQFRCRASNGAGPDAFSSAATLTVTSNDLPVATITEPVLKSGNLALIGFESGMVLPFAGTGVDEEDGSLPASAFTWQIDFHHKSHVHPFMPATTGIKSGSFTIPVSDDDNAALVWLRMYLWVTDSGGRTTQIYRDIYPATFLSDMNWISAVNWFPAGQPPKKDLSIGGNPITVGGVVYPKGLGMHPGGLAGQNAEVVYNLNGACSGQFVADVGIDDEATSTAASATFEVWLDGVKAWDSGMPPERASSPEKAVAVSVAGKNQLKLVVTNAGDGNNSDHGDWGFARVTRCAPSVRSGPSGFDWCANQDGTCSFSGTAMVAYGANGSFSYKSATNGIACNSSTFGDPAPGTTKACYYQMTTSSNSYEAENGTRGGAARVSSCSACSGGKKVGFIGSGSANDLKLTVSAPKAGNYTMTVAYLVSGTRDFFVSVNGGAGVKLTLSGSSFSVPVNTTMNVALNAGNNTVRFYNDTAFAPDLDRVMLLSVQNTPPSATCSGGGEFCNDPGQCTASVACSGGIAVCTDPNNDPTAVACMPASYPVGSTTVGVLCSDGQTTVTAGCPISVRDCEAPACNAPVPALFECNTTGGVSGSDPAVQAWLALASAKDNCGSVASFTSNAPAFFPLGTTVVTWTAKDPKGNQSQCSSTVTVADTTAPAITTQMSTCCLWPPTHELVDVGSYQAVDVCDPTAVSSVTATVTSDEPTGSTQGPGGPKHCADAVVDNQRISLRSERSGDNGRVYSISISAKDASGNVANKTVSGAACGCAGSVCVPHDQSTSSGTCSASDDGQKYNALVCQ